MPFSSLRFVKWKSRKFCYAKATRSSRRLNEAARLCAFRRKSLKEG
ncbi:hypothetical protein HanHA89_Chr09g0339621 [Helianthus annuus]|nr:hypothetical protein HanHA89_Chr09g0339621 [Helianthus annuus]